jgi:PPOX class probable F420-dependent enzyme
MFIDTNTEFGQRVERRLRDETVVWLTTVRPNGTPEPSPVWFYWDGATLLIYSRPNQQKLRDIARDPNVSLNFDSNGHGGDIVVITGEAAVESTAPASNDHPEYSQKYARLIAGIGYSADQFAHAFSVPIRVTPKKLRGH